MYVSSNNTRNGRNYETTLNVNFNIATLEVRDIETNEKWEIVFDSNYVDELTRRSGSVKTFPVFISMLESAIRETSTSVNIQLLCYSDFENLKKRKFDSNLPLCISKPPASNLNLSKFLILCHDGEFDRARYPLPLSYLGILDVNVLQEKLRKLQLEVATYRNQNSSIINNREVSNLKKEVEKLKKEKSEVENEFKEFKRIVDKRGNGMKESNKLARSLVVRLEGDLRSEVLRNRALLTKKTQENKTLNIQIKKLKASELKLRTEVDDLKSVVMQLKRSKFASEKCQNRASWSSLPTRSCRSSRESLTEQRTFQKQRSSIYSKPPKVRSLPSDSPVRLLVPENNRRSSTAGSRRTSRFDPTAYILETKQKRLEVEKKKLF